MAKKNQKKTKKKVIVKKAVSKKKTVKAKPKAKPKPKTKPKKATGKKVASKKPVLKKPVKKSAKKIVKKIVKKPIKKTAPKKVSAKPVKQVPKTVIVKKDIVKKKTINKVMEKKGYEKTTYGDKELQEFKILILDKLEASRKELKYLHEQINRTSDIGGDGSDQKFTGLEDGTGTSEREYLSQMASRQIQYIDHLEKALVRIQNKTYGICRITGKLISKERLRAVPHATMSMEAKIAQQQNK